MTNTVVTTGTFNLIHPGHVRFLKSARKLGDELVVFLDSDERNEQLKGDKAIFSFSERREIISSFSFVSKVLEYNGAKYKSNNGDPRSDFYRNLSCYTGQIIFAKSSEYNMDLLDPEEVEVLRKLGSIFVFIGHEEGYSTTKIVDKIEDSFVKACGLDS